MARILDLLRAPIPRRRPSVREANSAQRVLASAPHCLPDPGRTGDDRTACGAIDMRSLPREHRGIRDGHAAAGSDRRDRCRNPARDAAASHPVRGARGRVDILRSLSHWRRPRAESFPC